jgi:hypothetical protein
MPVVNETANFWPYDTSYTPTPPLDPLGFVYIGGNFELELVEPGTPITITGTEPGFGAGVWTGLVTTSNLDYIGFTPDDTEYMGDGSSAWDEYALAAAGGACTISFTRPDDIYIDWITGIIHVPRAFLNLVAGTLYQLDTDALRLVLKEIEDSEEGATFPDTHRHNTQYTVAGVTYARSIEIINGYSVHFENGLYSASLIGSNNNLFDVQAGILVQNAVQVIPNNSAGLIVSNATVVAPTQQQIRDAMKLTPTAGVPSAASLDILLTELHRILGLDPAAPLQVARTAKTAGTITQTIQEDVPVVGRVTITRTS